MSGRKLAEQLRIDKMTVSKWRTGRQSPTYPYAVDAAAALGVPIGDLWDDGQVRRPRPAAHQPPPRGDAAENPTHADAVLERLADLDIDNALRQLQTSAPDLLAILSQARTHTRRRRGKPPDR